MMNVGISEGDTKSFYTIKLVPLKDLESIVRPDIVHQNTAHSSTNHFCI